MLNYAIVSFRTSVCLDKLTPGAIGYPRLDSLCRSKRAGFGVTKTLESVPGDSLCLLGGDFVPEKRGSPLINPLREKTSSPSPKVNKFKHHDDGDDKGERRGVSKGGRERVKPAEAILKCLHCGRCLKIVFAVGRPPEWVRCTWCGELQPADGYHLVAYGRCLPRVLAPHEVKQQQNNRSILRR